MRCHATLRVAILLLAACLPFGAAHAQLFRAYVASTGNDANSCALVAPCRLLPAALAAVADGGEVWMLDSANYNTGTVSIAKSVSILAVPGAVGSVVANGGPAIVINSAPAKVALRNLLVVPIPGGGAQDGLQVPAATSVSNENCLFANLGGRGIHVTAPASVRIVDSTLRDLGFHAIEMSHGASGSIVRTTISKVGGTGVIAWGSNANTSITIQDSTIDNANSGVSSMGASNEAHVAIQGSTISNVVNYAVTTSGGTGSGFAAVQASTLTGGFRGIYASSGGRAWVARNLITRQDVGLYQSGTGVIESLGDNAIRHSVTLDTSGTITSIIGR